MLQGEATDPDMLADAGIDEMDFIVTASDDDETNLMAVANKQVDVSESNSEQIVRSKLKAPKAAAKIKVIWTSPLIPSDPMVYRKDLSKELKSRIKGFFLSYGRFGDTEAAKKVLANISDGQGFFMESNNTQLYPIRQLALFKDRLKIQNGSGASGAEKEIKISAIDKKAT